MRRTRGLAALLTLAAALTAPAAAPAATTLLPVSGFGDIATDPTNGHVYVTGAVDQANSTIAVMSSTGALLHTITNEPQAAGLAVSGSSLYVGLCGQDAIDVIDTTTYTRTTRISLGATGIAGGCKLRLGAGVIWFESAQGGASPYLGTVTLDADHTVATTTLNAVGPAFAVSPDLHTLVVGSGAQQYLDVGIFDVAAATPSQTASIPGAADSIGRISDLAFSHDGSVIYIAADASSAVATFSTVGGTFGGSVAPGAVPVAVAVSPDGRFFAAGNASVGSTAITIYGANASIPWVQWGGPATTVAVHAASLRWSPDARMLYAVVSDPAAGPQAARLLALDMATLGRTALPLTVTALPTVGGATSLTASLRYRDGADPTGHLVTLALRSPSGVRRTVIYKYTNFTGAMTTTIGRFLTARGTWHAIAHVGADDSHPAIDSTLAFFVRGRPSIVLSRTLGVVRYGEASTLVVRTSLPRGTRISVRSWMVAGSPVVTRSVRVGVGGVARVAVAPRSNSRFNVRFLGSAAWGPRSSGRVQVAVHAKILGVMLKPYGHSGGKALYHFTSACWTTLAKCPVYGSRVVGSHSGSLLNLPMQYLSGRRWLTVPGTQTPGTLDSTGILFAYLRYRGRSVIGTVARVRSIFYGDNRNVRTTSKWTYFKITK